MPYSTPQLLNSSTPQLLNLLIDTFMQKFWFLLLVLASSLLSVQSCYYDNEQDLYGGVDGCDTTAVKYSAQVTNLLENNCYACHSVASDVAGSPFDTYETLLPLAQSGKLVERINDAANPMPPTGLMPDCDRLKIEAWVNAGALKN